MKKPDFKNDILPMRDALQRVAFGITRVQEEAEAAVQDTMLRVWAQRERWHEIDNIQAYTMTVCRHIALDIVRRRHATLSLDEEGMQAPSHEASVHQRLEAEDTRGIIEIAYQALPVVQQRILALREKQEMSYDEIADALNLNMSQVKVYLMRARQRLRKAIESRE